METSAKANTNIEHAFFTLVRDIKNKTERDLVSCSLLLLVVCNFTLILRLTDLLITIMAIAGSSARANGR